MTYILDTNAISALMKADAGVIRRLQSTNRAQVQIPQPVIA